MLTGSVLHAGLVGQQGGSGGQLAGGSAVREARDRSLDQAIPARTEEEKGLTNSSCGLEGGGEQSRAGADFLKSAVEALRTMRQGHCAAPLNPEGSGKLRIKQGGEDGKKSFVHLVWQTISVQIYWRLPTVAC